MKWIIRIFGSIIGLFALAAVIGSFQPASLSIERSALIYAQPEDVFSYFSDLDDYQAWSPWQGEGGHQDYIVGGSDSGVGQRAAWTCADINCLQGTQEIIVVQEPEFVQANLYLDGKAADATYALMGSESADGGLTLLVKVDLHMGGFPYVQRLFKSNRRKAIETRLDVGLARLEALINEEFSNP